MTCHVIAQTTHVADDDARNNVATGRGDLLRQRYHGLFIVQRV